jgi:hypothetical protein
MRNSTSYFTMPPQFTDFVSGTASPAAIPECVNEFKS